MDSLGSVAFKRLTDGQNPVKHGVFLDAFSVRNQKRQQDAGATTLHRMLPSFTYTLEVTLCQCPNSGTCGAIWGSVAGDFAEALKKRQSCLGELDVAIDWFLTLNASGSRS
jgi:hypothetical protein